MQVSFFFVSSIFRFFAMTDFLFDFFLQTVKKLANDGSDGGCLFVFSSSSESDNC